MLDVSDGLDDEALAAALRGDPALLRHALGGHPTLDAGALAATVARVPRSWIVAHAAQSDPHEGRGAEEPIDDDHLVELVASAEQSGVSVRVYNLELLTEWSPVADALALRLARALSGREGELEKVNLGAFVASPGCVTPAHPDRHHNLFLQVHGCRELWIEDDPDRRRRHLRVLDYLGCPTAGLAELPPARRLVLAPGDGVYIPPYAFHWTRVVDGSAVALSIGFRTTATATDALAHELDGRLRRRGRRPRPSPPHSRRARTKARLEGLVRRRAARAATERPSSPPACVTVSPESGGAP